MSGDNYINKINFTLIGGPTTIFTLAGVTFMTDPTFSDPGEYDGLTKTAGPALQLSGLPTPDVILLSHDEHADNLDEVGRALLPKVGSIFSTPEAAGRIPNVTGMKDWESVDIAASNGLSITITAVPARHGPVGCETVTGTVTGFVLHGTGLPTVYVSGDNASTELVEEIAQRIPNINVAILFAGAARAGVLDNAALTLTAQNAVEVSQFLPQAKIVPVHADSWAHFSESIDDVTQAFAAAQLSERLLVAPLGVPVELN